MGLLSLLSRIGPMKQLHPDLKALLPEGWTSKRLVSAITSRHPLIAPLFGTDCGLDLMFTESQILVALLLRLETLGIPALPMHDGIMVPQSRKAAAMQAMRDVSEHKVGTALPVREKPIVRGIRAL